MSRRERLQARLDKRREWAEARERKSAAAFESARRIADNIPFGQPILVGHHSEGHARRDAARIDSGMRRGVESQKMAEHHTSTAGGIADQLADSIFSDDPDAAEALEAKAAAIETACERKKAVNAAFRKAPGADSGEKLLACVAAGTMTQAEALKAARLFSLCPYEKQPHPAYELSNARANARRCRERVKEVARLAEQTAKAEAAPGGVLVEVHASEYHAAGYAVVTFPDYPGRATVDALKAAGFHWSRPSWHGAADKLPECVREMIEPPAEGGA